MTYGNIACAEVNSLEPTSKNPDDHGSTMFFIWVYYPNRRSLEASLQVLLEKVDWDKEAYDWKY